MTKNRKNNNGNRGQNNGNGGTMTKVAGETASIAPEGGTATTDGTEAEQDGETAGQVQLVEPEQPEQPEVTEPAGDPAEQPEQPADGEQVEQTAEAPADPFADLPVVQLGDYELKDLTTVQGNAAFKYESVHKEAVEGKLHTKKGWKHAADMIAMGRTHKEFKPTSVWGTIAQIVASYGRAGVPAAVLVAAVRQKQIGNKRSKYCTQLPPIGWAEGWIDTFISKGYGRVMEKKAPALTGEQVAEQATEAAQQVAA